MRKIFTSKEPKDIVWLWWGTNQLRRMVVAGQRGTRRFFPEKDVQVTIDGSAESVWVHREPVAHWFAGAVEFKCSCRAIQIEDVGTIDPVSVSTPFTGPPWTYSPVATTFGTKSFQQTDNTYVSTGTEIGVDTTTWTGVGIVTTVGVGQEVVYSPPVTLPYSPYIEQFIPYINAWRASFDFTAYNAATIAANQAANAAAFAAAQQAAAAENARRAAEAKVRVAAFLTDGTELSSIPARPIANSSGSTSPNVFEPSTQNIPWNGGSSAQLFDYVSAGGSGSANVVASDVLTFDVPEDACYIKRPVPNYPGASPRPSLPTANILTTVSGTTTTYTLRLTYAAVQHVVAVGTRTIINTQSEQSDVSVDRPDGFIRNWNEDSGTFEYAILNGSPDNMERSFVVAQIPAPYMTALASWKMNNASKLDAISQWELDWNAAQAKALNRARAWRKKCSDGRISMLRNGILPPEFEHAIKRLHPASKKLKRSLPMSLEHQEYKLISDTTENISLPAGGTTSKRTRVYSGDISIAYGEDDDRRSVSYNGSLTHIQTTHVYKSATATSNVYSYSTFPMLSNADGVAYPLPGSLPPEHPYITSAMLRVEGSLILDSSQYPLLVVADGEVTQSDWVPSSEYGTPNYREDADKYIPPIPKSSDYTTLAHPEFIYEYIAASKPIEFEVIDGVKRPVTPSIRWLSSRLADKETVTIIPLSYVTDEGEERGMFAVTTNPIDRDYEYFTHIRIYGFARFRFDYATSTFKFKDWTEFTAGGKVTVSDAVEYQYDDEISPTTLTVGDTIYTLKPIDVPCELDWINTNCVFIGDKAPWTDTREMVDEQRTAFKDESVTSDDPLGSLYRAVREAIRDA